MHAYFYGGFFISILFFIYLNCFIIFIMLSKLSIKFLVKHIEKSDCKKVLSPVNDPYK